VIRSFVYTFEMQTYINFFILKGIWWLKPDKKQDIKGVDVKK